MGSWIMQNNLLYYVFLSQQITQPAYFMSKLKRIYMHFYRGHVFKRVLLSTGECIHSSAWWNIFLVQFLIWWRTSVMRSTRLLCSSSSSLDAVCASLFLSLCSSHNREHEVSEGLYCLVFLRLQRLSLIVCLSEEAVFIARWGVFSFIF